MLDINRLMNGLAAERPVFHSEADFQFALAWRIKKATTYDVRLEFKPFPEKRMYLDLWLPDIGVAVELKYLTRKLEVERNGESFALRDQGAQDLGRYDVLNDLQRLERVVAKAPHERRGIRCSSPTTRSTGSPRIDGAPSAEFRLHEDRKLPGEMSWSKRAPRGANAPFACAARTGFYGPRRREVADPSQQVTSRTTGCRRLPANQIRPSTEEDDREAVARGAGPFAAFDPRSSRATRHERRRGRRQTRLSRPAESRRLPLTGRPARAVPGQDLVGKLGMDDRRVAHFHCPERPPDVGQVLRVVDLLVPEELGPGPVRGVRKAMHELPGAVPPPPRRRSGLAEEGKPGIGVPKRDHVAGKKPRAAASFRTRSGPRSSGIQAPVSRSAGVLPPSAVRLRSNQRLTPISL